MENYRIFISAPADQAFKKFSQRTKKEIEQELSVLYANPFAGERLSGPLNLNFLLALL